MIRHHYFCILLILLVFASCEHLELEPTSGDTVICKITDWDQTDTTLNIEGSAMRQDELAIRKVVIEGVSADKAKDNFSAFKASLDARVLLAEHNITADDLNPDFSVTVDIQMIAYDPVKSYTSTDQIIIDGSFLFGEAGDDDTADDDVTDDDTTDDDESPA